MRGRDFLDTARRLCAMNSESDWRSAISRAYSGFLLEWRDALKRWGFKIAPRMAHSDVYQHLRSGSTTDLKQLATRFQNLSSKRNRADNDLSSHRSFASSRDALDTVMDAKDGIILLDAIEADPVRLAQAIADIRAAFP